jgi:hypothetical protein
MIHGAGEEDSEFAKQVGVVLEARRGKSIEIIEVARVVTVDHGLELSCEQFLRSQD